MSGQDDQLQIEDQRFAIVPEWVIDLPVGDVAFRLYATLLRYGGTSGSRMPSRSTLAARLRRSVDTVDRAMRELETAGAVVIERRRDGGKHLTNRYHLRTSGPGRAGAATPSQAPRHGRTAAATGSRTAAAWGGRTTAAQVAAPVRPDPEVLTESILTQTEELARVLRAERLALGLALRGWSNGSVARAVERARERGWPDSRLPQAFLRVARDSESRSPLRVAEAGAWWMDEQNPVPAADGLDAQVCEQLLDTLDGDRLRFQRAARVQLEAEGAALTRTTVLRRAVALAGLTPTSVPSEDSGRLRPLPSAS